MELLAKEKRLLGDEEDKHTVMKEQHKKQVKELETLYENEREVTLLFLLF